HRDVAHGQRARPVREVLVPGDDAGMVGGLVEDLVMPEAQALEPEELGGGHGGPGVVDEVAQGGLDQPAAQAMERVAVWIAVVVLLDLVEEVEMWALSAPDPLHGVAYGLQRGALQDAEAGDVAEFLEGAHLLVGEAEA